MIDDFERGISSEFCKKLQNKALPDCKYPLWDVLCAILHAGAFRSRYEAKKNHRIWGEFQNAEKNIFTERTGGIIMNKKPALASYDCEEAFDAGIKSEIATESEILNDLSVNGNDYSKEISEELSAVDNFLDRIAHENPRHAASDDPMRIHLKAIAQKCPFTDDELKARYEQYRSAQKEADDLDQKENDILAGIVNGGPDEFNEVRRQRKKAIARAERIRNDIIEHNLRLVLAAVGRFHIQYDSDHYSDVVQSGVVGLIRAVPLYDHTKGYKFSTYAWAWICRDILSYLDRNQSMLHISKNMNRDIRKYDAARSELLAEQEKPNAENVANKLGWSRRHTQKVIEANFIQDVESLNATLEHDNSGAAERADLVEDQASTNFIYLTENREMLEALFNKYLPDTWADIMKRFYGFSPYTENQTYEEIERAYGLGVKEIDAQMRRIASYLAGCCRLNDDRFTFNE